MNLNWTTIIASGLVAAIVGTIQLIANRYTNRVLDHVEKLLGNGKPIEKK